MAISTAQDGYASEKNRNEDCGMEYGFLVHVMHIVFLYRTENLLYPTGKKIFAGSKYLFFHYLRHH